MLRSLTGRGQLCLYLVAAEGVEAPHSFGQLRSRNDEEVGTEELHEPVVLGALLLSCAGELVGITKCPLRVAHRHLAGGAMDRDTVTLRITREVAADQPLGPDRHEPTDHETAGFQRLEHARSHVRIHAIRQLVNEVLYDERVAVAAADLEYALHNVAPAEQQLAFVLGQVRATSHKPLHHGLAAA